MIEDRLKNILKFKSRKEREEFEVMNFQSDIVQEILKVMRKRRYTKQDLASKMNTSVGYLTQIFSMDKELTLKYLNRIIDALEAKLIIKIY